MRRLGSILLALVAINFALRSRAQSLHPHPSCLGFDRNEYPGDAALTGLRQSFRFAGYWLNAPPGAAGNTWTGKRQILRQHGFGFLVLFNGRTDAELKGRDAAALGSADGRAAVAAAAREGFPRHVLIFLDQEEGGRLLSEQAAYIFAWARAVRAAGARAGVYCSALDVPEGTGSISTARDLVEREEKQSASAAAGARLPRLFLWVANDRCPPSPGCAPASLPPSSGFAWGDARAVVWQYALSPRRPQFSASCPRNAAADGNCYAPAIPSSRDTFVDLDLAASPDPSEDR